MKLYRELHVYQYYNEKNIPQEMVSLQRLSGMVPAEQLVGVKTIHKLDQDYVLLDDIFDIVTRNGWWYVNTYWMTDNLGLGMFAPSGHAVLTFITEK